MKEFAYLGVFFIGIAIALFIVIGGLKYIYTEISIYEKREETKIEKQRKDLGLSIIKEKTK